MSRLLIRDYLAEIDRLRAASGSRIDAMKRCFWGEFITLVAQRPYRTGFSRTVALALIGNFLVAVSPAFSQIIPQGKCAVIAASRSSLQEAQQWISQNPSFPSRAIIKYGNGQYAVTLGLIDKTSWRDLVASLVASGQAPPDAFCSATGAESLAWVANSSLGPVPGQPSAPYPGSPDAEAPAFGVPSGTVATALLLFDGQTGQKFVGCLNCSNYDAGSVCNRYGDYGSRYSEESIWNAYGDYGSRYEENSPWNPYGEGLRIS